jgi:DNA-directed RNA polymerase specialized sigma24 family protein
VSPWERLRARYESELFGLAFVLSGDERRAAAVVRDALRRAVARYEDRRGADALELFLFGRIVHHVPRSATRRDDPSWNAWIEISPKRRAVLALLLRGHLGEQRVADAMGWSVSAVRKAADRGLTEWGRATGGDRDSLQALLAAQVQIPAATGAGAALVLRRLLPLLPAATLVAAVILAPLHAGPSSVAPPEAEGAAEASGLATAPPSLSPHGSHDVFCPNLDGVLSFGPGAARKASRVALAFNAGLVRDDRRVIATFIDPWPGALNLKPRPWDHTKVAHGVDVVHSASADSDGPATDLCGVTTAARSWKVVMHDSTGSSSTSQSSFYLVRRPHGWKVWGSF